jgi:excisionase family DNA binding protein
MSTDTMTLPALLKLSEVMAKTGLSRSAVYRVINTGQLKTVKIGRSVRVKETDLHRFIESLGQ